MSVCGEAGVLFAGDPHGDFREIITATRWLRPLAVVLLGDYDLERPLHVELSPILDLAPVRWIVGNHDTDRESWYRNLVDSELANCSIDARVDQIAGIRVAGLGGIYREPVWHPDMGLRLASREQWLAAHSPAEHWDGGIGLRDRSSIFWEDYERLAGVQADVLVTHEAPTTHEHGFREIDELAEFIGALTIVHGHHHIDYNSQLPSGIRVFGIAAKQVLWLPMSYLTVHRA